MNLTVEPTELSTPTPVTPPPAKSRKRLTLTLGIGLGLGVIAVVATATAMRGDDLEGTANLNPVTAGLAAAPAGESAGSPDAGTGDASVDMQIADMVWESTGKASICPAFNEAKAAMPSMSDEQIVDMGMALADMDSLTPAQIDRIRELTLAEC